MENRELFEGYEITGWQLSPKVYKYIAAAAGLHLFAFAVLSQFNLVQTKACDSPYIGKMCEILDVASLGSSLLGTNTEFADKDYDKTEIKEGDVTYIDVSGQEPPFTYPEGYFAAANPEQAQLQATNQMQNSGNFSMSNNPPASLDMNTPQVLPTPNERVANQKLPDSPFDFGDSPFMKTPPVKNRVPNYPPRTAKRPPVKNDSPSKLPEIKGDETASTNANSNSNNQSNANTTAKTENANKAANSNQTVTADEDKNKFNSKPLKDFGEKYGTMILKKDVNINAPFTIVVIGKLDENGKITNPQMQAAPGSDPKMTEVAKEAIAAFSDTNLLKPLYDVGLRDIKITFSQDKDNLQAIIQTAAKSESNAKSIQSLLNLFIKNSSVFMRKDSDEAKLLSRAELNTQGNIFIINFLISNDEKNQLIEKSLKNLQEKKSQPNSLAINKTASARS